MAVIAPRSETRRSAAVKLTTLSLPALLVATLLAMTCVELRVRSTWDPHRGTPGFYLSDPVRGQRLGEGYVGWFAGVHVRINRLGLRDPREYDLAKRPNTFRILVLGDSVTFGHGSLYETTYPYLLEQRLKRWRPDVNWQVWNAAVPGYNTSQELAQLVEVGPQFRPDLVVVGFFENDVMDNTQPGGPTRPRRIASAVESFARRHLYSIELYKRVYYEIAWRLARSNDYRKSMAQLAQDEVLTPADASGLKEQTLTPYEWLPDEQVRAVNCVNGERASPDVGYAIQREAGYAAWLQAVRGLGDLQRAGEYRIVFFLNIIPRACPDGDVFYDVKKYVNEFFVRTFRAEGPTVSCHDAFLHVKPSQMPNATNHALGNSNAVKADVLFEFLRDRTLPALLPPDAHDRAAS